VTEATPTRAPVKKSNPPRGAAKPAVVLLEIALLVVLGVVVYHKFGPKSDRRDAAVEKAEQAAAKTLRQQKVLVIMETHDPAVPDDKRVTSVNFCGTSVFGNKPIDDSLLAELDCFTDLQSLNVGDCKITGVQLKYFAGLKKMASLVLSDTAVDDRGLENLRALEAIESLNLRDTAISDAGLDSIAALRNLKVLDLSKTEVTDAGIKKLLPLGDLKWLLLAETSLTDHGLDQLAPLVHLGRLTLNKTHVTAAGMAKLKRSIPGLAIDFDNPNAQPAARPQSPRPPQGEQPPAAAAGDQPAPPEPSGDAK